MTPLHVKRLPYRLDPDNSRTITRFFWPGPERAQRIVTRVMALPKTEVKAFLQTTLQEFVHRHVDLEELLLAQFEKLVDRINANIKATASQKLLLGAYFTMEYAFESAALFNPSMVPRLADTDTPPGATPFLMSLRAVGEGHVSSIVFRRGMILASGVVYVEPVGPLTRCLETSQHWNPDKGRVPAQTGGDGLSHARGGRRVGPRDGNLHRPPIKSGLRQGTRRRHSLPRVRSNCRRYALAGPFQLRNSSRRS